MWGALKELHPLASISKSTIMSKIMEKVANA